MAAGTVTITEETMGAVKKITFDWTAGTAGQAGTATGTTTGAYNGKVERLVTAPAKDSLQPTNSYSITITDDDSPITDVLSGAGAARSNVNTEQVASTSLGIVANSRLTINVTAAGSGGKGTAYLFIR